MSSILQSLSIVHPILSIIYAIVSFNLVRKVRGYLTVVVSFQLLVIQLLRHIILPLLILKIVSVLILAIYSLSDLFPQKASELVIGRVRSVYLDVYAVTLSFKFLGLEVAVHAVGVDIADRVFVLAVS